MKIVGLKELRQDPGRYANLVKQGQSFLVVKRSKPLFRLSPVEAEDELWEEAVDFTKIKRGGVAINELLARL
ncbi:MAG TPA: type II toxin-antitoxin system prevent-host-death family antitoxin [Patescibacteria group bacterium]|nr:type II toxin-antitoxin system prevent-host-death family antitoxin [Patescibacteria group bacterium]